jgi:hypothetical protein
MTQTEWPQAGSPAAPEPAQVCEPPATTSESAAAIKTPVNEALDQLSSAIYEANSPEIGPADLATERSNTRSTAAGAGEPAAGLEPFSTWLDTLSLRPLEDGRTGSYTTADEPADGTETAKKASAAAEAIKAAEKLYDAFLAGIGRVAQFVDCKFAINSGPLRVGNCVQSRPH